MNREPQSQSPEKPKKRRKGLFASLAAVAVLGGGVAAHEASNNDQEPAQQPVANSAPYENTKNQPTSTTTELPEATTPEITEQAPVEIGEAAVIESKQEILTKRVKEPLINAYNDIYNNPDKYPQAMSVSSTNTETVGEPIPGVGLTLEDGTWVMIYAEGQTGFNPDSGLNDSIEIIEATRYTPDGEAIQSVRIIAQDTGLEVYGFGESGDTFDTTNTDPNDPFASMGPDMAANTATNLANYIQ